MERGDYLNSRIRVLVADADQRYSRAIAKALSVKPNIEIIAQTKTSYETVGKAIALTPDVIIMDIQMETTQAGILALSQICKSLPEAQVIVYSEVKNEKTICRVFEEGAVNYLFKPANATAIAYAVNAAGRKMSSIHQNSAAVLLRDYQRAIRLEKQLSSIVQIAMHLTETELSILKLMNGGMKAAEIEKIRFIEHSTMKTHISHIIKKFGMETISQVLNILKECDFFNFLDES